MNKINTRLMEIAGHLDAITEQMKANKADALQGSQLTLYVVEIEELAEEMKGLLDLTSI